MNRDATTTSHVINNVASRIVGRFRHSDMHLRILVIAVIVVLVALSLTNRRGFLSAANFQSMLIQVSEIGLLTLGMSITMLIASIDLSITVEASLSAILGGFAMHAMVEQGLSSPVAAILGTIICIVSGGALGLVNGLLIAFGRVTPILATMATMMLYGGVGTVLTGGVSISQFPQELLHVGHAMPAGIPAPVLVLAAAAITLWFVLNRVPFGLKMRLAGANARASAFSGIDNKRIIITTHSMAGLLAAFAGLATLVQTDSANSQYGSTYLLMTILIAVLGGVSIFGGKGTVGGVVLALALFQLLSSGMNMLLAGVTRGNFFQNIVWGALLLVILTASMLATSGARRRRIVVRSGDRSAESGRPDNESTVQVGQR